MKKLMKKIIAVLAICASISGVSMAASDTYVESWATSYVGEWNEDERPMYTGHEKRINAENSLYEADATGANQVEGHFTGIGYFSPEGIEYYFEKDCIVNNPDETAPDLLLSEITWDNNSKWIGEGAEVWAIDYNGTGEDVLIAYAYNKTAENRVTEYNSANPEAGVVLQQVEGANIETELISGNIYQTKVYFSDEFEFCKGIRLIDITDELKQYGGNGQDTYDGYDLDAIKAYTVISSRDVEYYIYEGSVDKTNAAEYKITEYPVQYQYTVEGAIFTREGYNFVAWSTPGTGEIFGDLNKEDIPNYSVELNYYAPGYEFVIDESWAFYGIWEEIEEIESGDNCNKPEKPGCHKPNKPEGGCGKGERPNRPEGGCGKDERPNRPEGGCGKDERPNRPEGGCGKYERPNRPEGGCGKDEGPNRPEGGCGKYERPNRPEGGCGKDERPNRPEGGCGKGERIHNIEGGCRK